MTGDNFENKRSKNISKVFGLIYITIGVAFLVYFFIYLEKGKQFLLNWQKLFGTQGMLLDFDVVLLNFLFLAIGISLVIVGINKIIKGSK